MEPSDKEAVQPEGLDTELIELLIDGARYDDLEDVQQALNNHADVNAADTAGRTGVELSWLHGIRLILLHLASRLAMKIEMNGLRTIAVTCSATHGCRKWALQHGGHSAKCRRGTMSDMCSSGTQMCYTSS